MNRTPDTRRDQRKPQQQQQPKPGERDYKPGAWVDALIKQIRERHK